MKTDSFPNALSPIDKTERIQILDILRGFAVFGILAVNIGGFASPAFYPGGCGASGLVRLSGYGAH
jgi:uncharacterized membrane protein YeiB